MDRVKPPGKSCPNSGSFFSQLLLSRVQRRRLVVIAELVFKERPTGHIRASSDATQHKAWRARPLEGLRKRKELQLAGWLPRERIDRLFGRGLLPYFVLRPWRPSSIARARPNPYCGSDTPLLSNRKITGDHGRLISPGLFLRTGRRQEREGDDISKTYSRCGGRATWEVSFIVGGGTGGCGVELLLATSRGDETQKPMPRTYHTRYQVYSSSSSYTCCCTQYTLPAAIFVRV